MISWPNKSKQTLNPVPMVTTARGERETVLVLSSEQKDSGSLMQKAFLFFVCFWVFLSSFKKKKNKKTSSTTDTISSTDTLAQISREKIAKFIRLVSRWLC